MSEENSYLEQLPAMEDEHEAWLRVGHEFRAQSIDINDERWTPLVRAIELWGEKLHALRDGQQESIVEQALADKALAYEPIATPGFERE